MRIGFHLCCRRVQTKTKIKSTSAKSIAIYSSAISQFGTIEKAGASPFDGAPAKEREHRKRKIRLAQFIES
jgi:hypothetical protein